MSLNEKLTLFRAARQIIIGLSDQGGAVLHANYSSVAYELRALSSFRGGNAHCATGNISWQSLRHAFREVSPG